MGECPITEATVLLLVGPGGNGGDALYAGTELLMSGIHVEATFLNPSKTHPQAREAFAAAGGRERRASDLPDTRWDLIIDGLLGIGARGGLRDNARALANAVEGSAAAGTLVLAIDVPSGIEADSGATGGVHLRADVTITFGGLRRAHALCPECGEVILADPRLPEHCDPRLAEQRSISSHLNEGNSALRVTRAWAGGDQLSDFDLRRARGATLHHISTCAGFPQQEPTSRSDKYSGGVVGIAAGSPTYPGAAVLCTAGAVRATSSMVRYVGGSSSAVLAAHPEVVVSPSVAETGRVQAWVLGPGRGTDKNAAAELTHLLSSSSERDKPLLLDADALTLLAEHPSLMETLRARTGAGVSRETPCGEEAQSTRAGGPVVLTPHAGECRRLLAAWSQDEAAGEDFPDPKAAPLTAVETLARWSGCLVLLKGRMTLISDGHRTWAIDCGSSWAATPGSGDVLAGIVGALMAREPVDRILLAVLNGVLLHARAAVLGARRAAGSLTINEARGGSAGAPMDAGEEAPISAMNIAEAVPLAWTYRGDGAHRSLPVDDRRNDPWPQGDGR